ncbi:hypothetical protein Taro_049740 [Colocasia esculenta]|uniref:Putative plant transposon protein domain-containing protein n=1 Tax=Colocasia esculenta TaxID=4460 RepID=A0A843XBN5_COLES|nr:hypothetical protein [Colocasia esculenta]
MGQCVDTRSVDEDLPHDQDDVRDGETTSSSDSDDDQPPPVSEAGQKGKEVEPEEMGTMKNLLGDILKVVGAQIPPPPPPAAQVPESGPSRPSVQEAGPIGPEAAAAPAEAAVNVQRPSGQAEQVSGPTEPLESESVQTEAEEESLAPKPPAPSSPSHTPIPPTPPSAPTAPPAPQTFNKPQSRPISSPTPFPPHSTSSPASSTTIHSPSPILEAPLASSTGASSSSSGPSLGPVDDLPTTSHSFLHPTPPPSFITIIPERAQLNSPFMEKIKDEFEEGILRYVHRLPEVQLSQFRKAISALTPDISHSSDVQVDFATFQVPEEIALLQIHFLVMESSVGSIIFERFARVIGRIRVQKGCLVAFPRFLFREYHQGHLFALNEAQAREGKPAISPATFLDMNSIHLVNDPFKVWEERYKEDLVVSRVLFPFSCEGRPGGGSRVLLFPSGLKEDQLSWVLASVPFLPTILQNPSLFNSMAASGVSSTVGGYNIAFLSTEQQERFAAVMIKIYGNKAVDIAYLEKNGMHSVVAAMQRMKWTRMMTISEASYPDLVKAFYTCLKSEEDGSLTSTVKGTPIHISYDLLESLFGVSTVGCSGVDNVDIHVKGLGIIRTEYKLKDGKIDINQLNAFNRIVHFIVCQILVPRSATFSTCPKADSYMMFWAIQNQDINMAEVIIERMKFASAMIWDKKNKLNVSLPYAHLLTRIFQHFHINLNGEVSEKMGQAIRSRNLKKSGFSLVAGVWSKTSVAEGEAIIGEA